MSFDPFAVNFFRLFQTTDSHRFSRMFAHILMQSFLMPSYLCPSRRDLNIVLNHHLEKIGIDSFDDVASAPLSYRIAVPYSQGTIKIRDF